MLRCTAKNWGLETVEAVLAKGDATIETVDIVDDEEEEDQFGHVLVYPGSQGLIKLTFSLTIIGINLRDMMFLLLFHPHLPFI